MVRNRYPSQAHFVRVYFWLCLVCAGVPAIYLGVTCNALGAFIGGAIGVGLALFLTGADAGGWALWAAFHRP